MKKTEMLNQLKTMDEKALIKELDEATAGISKLKTAYTFGRDKNTKKILELKKKRARIWTVLTQKMISGEQNDK